jgi:hypothetical protein
MNVRAQRNTRGRARVGVQPWCMVLVSLVLGLLAVPAAAHGPGPGSPNVAVDPRTGNETYLPTGERIDLVVPVTAPAAVPEIEPASGKYETLALGVLALPALALALWLLTRARGRAPGASKQRPASADLRFGDNR